MRPVSQEKAVVRDDDVVVGEFPWKEKHDVETNGTSCGGARSIYDVFGRRRYFFVLLAAYANFMMPLSDIIFLPAIVAAMTDLGTTPAYVAATMAGPMFSCGVSALLLGPACDRIGRRPVVTLSALVLTAFALGCAFAPNIITLIACRVVQGVSYAGLLVSTNALLADVFRPEERGRWMGVASVPALLSPIIAPPLGGALALRYGWRSTFIAGGIFSAVLLALALAIMKETHQYMVLRAVRKTEGDAAADSIQEAGSIPVPGFQAPWKPLLYLVERDIAPFAIVAIVSQAAMVSAIIAMPAALAVPPYNLDAAQIGLATIPCGAVALVSAFVGGFLADFAARRHPAHPSGRMLPGVLAALVVLTCFLVLYGWMLQLGGPLPVVLAASGFLGTAMCIYMPGLFSYITILKQSSAASAGGVINSATHIMQGVFTQVTPFAVLSMGIAPYLTLAAGLVFLLSAAALVIIVRALRSGSGGGSAGTAATR